MKIKRARTEDRKAHFVSCWWWGNSVTEVGAGCQSPCTLTIVFCSDLLCTKAFPQAYISLPATLVRDNPFGDLCPWVLSRCRNDHFATHPPLPLLSHPPPFLRALPLWGAAVLYSLNNFTFFLSVPVFPTTAFKDKILLSNDPEYYQLIDKDPQSS